MFDPVEKGDSKVRKEEKARRLHVQESHDQKEEKGDGCRGRKICSYNGGKIKVLPSDAFHLSKKIISLAENYLEEMEEGLGNLDIKQVTKQSLGEWESKPVSGLR